RGLEGRRSIQLSYGRRRAADAITRPPCRPASPLPARTAVLVASPHLTRGRARATTVAMAAPEDLRDVVLQAERAVGNAIFSTGGGEALLAAAAAAREGKRAAAI